MRRVKVSKQPTLHIHRYVVVIYVKLSKAKFRYCMNREDVRELRNKAPKGSVIEVFSATHEHKETWVK